MSKVITSQSKIWTGTVTLAEPLTLPQVEKIEAAMDFRPGESEKVWFTTLDREKLPAILACVEKWELKGFPESVTIETFPLTPRPASHKLVDWLWGELWKVYIGELEIPNE